MGQYWYPVNLTKKEFFHPHSISQGLKLCEIVWGGGPDVGSALALLLAAGKAYRGGGDIEPSNALAPVLGRWAGDKVALVGDYAQKKDLPACHKADYIYEFCSNAHYRHEGAPTGGWKDISEEVAAALAKEFGGRFDGEADGYRHWKEGDTAS
jgi:hypothetical protein